MTNHGCEQAENEYDFNWFEVQWLYDNMDDLVFKHTDVNFLLVMICGIHL